jgi:membrane protein DedA with SNARE-associated domain
LSGLEKILVGYFEHFTYLGIFTVLLLCGMGIPIPEDIVLITSGYLVYTGYIRLSYTILVCLVGVVLGDFVIYLIGKRWGEQIISHHRFSRVLTKERVHKAREYFAKYGTKAVFIARHLSGLRFPIYFTAGMVRMPPVKFVLVDLAAAFITVPLLISLSYYLGDHIDRFIHVVKQTEHALFAIMMIVVLLFILTRLRGKEV